MGVYVFLHLSFTNFLSLIDSFSGSTMFVAFIGNNANVLQMYVPPVAKTTVGYTNGELLMQQQIYSQQLQYQQNREYQKYRQSREQKMLLQQQQKVQQQQQVQVQHSQGYPQTRTYQSSVNIPMAMHPKQPEEGLMHRKQHKLT